MSEGKELPFQREQRPLLVSQPAYVIAPKLRQSFLRRFTRFQQGPELCHVLVSPVLQQRKKQIFLCAEVGIESTARVAHGGGNVLDAGGLKPIACKDGLRRLEKFP